ncbi:IS4 family transposase [Xenorhabdus littoralis]|uniref:IS4 family transposase n=1 Tax=Xenorhabdus littoralis TaxID=2582835 RepID=UPI0029E7E309|nr:IS4 family transposase [Xenorhabdus sp. psl]MDX7992992.1 IS4 family transposase [Xenorhabdus sp. psl]
MFSIDTSVWAQATFQQAKLGDARRTKRLILLASQLAANTGKSIVQSHSSSAEIEAAYRFVRNDDIDAQAIAEAGFAATVDACMAHNCLLALEDSTSLEFKHPTAASELGHTTSHKNSSGLQVHSVLLFSPEEQQVIGLIEQHRWTRDSASYGQRKDRNRRAYEDKESDKWQRASQAMSLRLGEQMNNVISVCDREADIIEYLRYKTEQQQRFVVRSMQSRCIEQADDRLHPFSASLCSAGERIVHVQQKGGRKSRYAICDIRFAPVSIKIPSNKTGHSISLFYVGCQEQGDNEGLCWHLLTNEPVTTAKQAQKILEYYEKRWLIEDFHKSWKTGGTQVEELRMQSKDNLERMIVVLAFIAVRIQQLRYLSLQTERAKNLACESLLSPIAWKLLWLKTESKTLPKQVPSLHWAYLKLGRLAGWNDSKRTGIVGWQRLWEGGFKLQTLLEGYQLALSLDSEM